MPCLVAYFVIFEVMFSVFLLTDAYNATVGICDPGDHVRSHVDEPKCTPKKDKDKDTFEFGSNIWSEIQ